MAAYPPSHSFGLNTLTIAVSAFSRAASAWRDVSASGAAHVVLVANALLTLSEHKTFQPAAPAPGALASVADEAAASLSWIQRSVERLSRALRGLEDHSVSLQSFATEKDGPVVATLDPRQWSRIYSAGVTCLQRDLEEKKEVLDTFYGVLEGSACVDRYALETAAETWLEMSCVDDGALETVSAAFAAESSALQALETSLSSDVSSTRVVDRSPRPATPSPGKSASPALHLLLSGEAEPGAKSKRKKKR